jgi:plastocyanin
MPIISQLNTANTFSQWLTGTQDLISKVNELVEGGNNFTFYSNTNLSVANNLTIGGNLTVSGNIVLDSISFDDINSNGSASFANNLSVTGNTTLTNLAVSGSANISTLTSASGLLTSRTNIFVDGWALSSNDNVRTGVTTFSVTNAGSGAYLFDQYSGNNPDIYLHPGQTVSFNINAPGHPFLLRQTNGGTLYNNGLTHVTKDGIVTVGNDAQAKETGTLIWKVPFELTGNTYVYQCQNHSGMIGNLIIQSTVTAALAAAVASTGDSLAFAIALG